MLSRNSGDGSEVLRGRLALDPPFAADYLKPRSTVDFR